MLIRPLAKVINASIITFLKCQHTCLYIHMSGVVTHSGGIKVCTLRPVHLDLSKKQEIQQEIHMNAFLEESRFQNAIVKVQRKQFFSF